MASERHTITVNWIKAHNDYEGNELADMLAKDGAQGLGNGVVITTKVATKVIKTNITRHTTKIWNKRWEEGKDARVYKKRWQCFNYSAC